MNSCLKMRLRVIWFVLIQKNCTLITNRPVICLIMQYSKRTAPLRNFESYLMAPLRLHQEYILIKFNAMGLSYRMIYFRLRRDFIFDEFYFNFNLINFYLRRNFPSPGAAWVKSCQGSIYYLISI